MPLVVGHREAPGRPGSHTAKRGPKAEKLKRKPKSLKSKLVPPPPTHTIQAILPEEPKKAKAHKADPFVTSLEPRRLAGNKSSSEA